MHLKALSTIIHDGVTYKPGATIPDVSDADAKVLIPGGFAVESDEAPAKPQGKGKKATAEKPAAEPEATADDAAEAATGGESDGN